MHVVEHLLDLGREVLAALTLQDFCEFLLQRIVAMALEEALAQLLRVHELEHVRRVQGPEETEDDIVVARYVGAVLVLFMGQSVVDVQG